MAFHPVVPILRSFDEGKARELYVDWLGFKDELEAFHAELQTRPYKNYRPGLQDQEWGAREMIVQDGAGNTLVFYRDLANT